MTADKLFNAIFNAGLVIMLLTLVASLGMTYAVPQILAPLRRVWLLLGTILVNSILAPFVAIGICHLFSLSSETRVGIEIVTIAAAGPAGLKASQMAKRADLPMAISFTIVLQLLNIVAAPLWAKAIVTGATVNVWSVVSDLLLLVLLPLVIGLVARSRYPEHADAWKTNLEKISDIALYIAIAAGLAVNWNAVISSLGSSVILVSAVIVLAYLALGWVAGMPHNQESAITISMVSSFRFTPIGLVVISTVLKNQSVYLTPALLFALVDTIIPFVAGAEIGRYVTRAGTQPAAAVAQRGQTEKVPAAPGARRTP